MIYRDVCAIGGNVTYAHRGVPALHHSAVQMERLTLAYTIICGSIDLDEYAFAVIRGGANWAYCTRREVFKGSHNLIVSGFVMLSTWSTCFHNA